MNVESARRLYIFFYTFIWFLVNLLALIEVIANFVVIGRYGWIAIIVIYATILFFMCGIIYINVPVKTNWKVRNLQIHVVYSLAQALAFVPVVFGTGLDIQTVSDSRFKEYLTVFFVATFPGISILILYGANTYKHLEY